MRSGSSKMKDRTYLVECGYVIASRYPFSESSSSLELSLSISSNSSSACEGRHSMAPSVAAAPSLLRRPSSARSSGAWLGAWLGALVSPPPSG